jgi:hypothetical protein
MKCRVRILNIVEINFWENTLYYVTLTENRTVLGVVICEEIALSGVMF